MERPLFATELLNAGLDNNLLNFWKQNSPDRKLLYPWEEVRLLPRKDLRGVKKIIEVIGLSRAGKSSFISELSSKYINDPKVIVWSEFTDKKDGIRGNLGTKLRMIGHWRKEFGITHQMMIWNKAKLVSTLIGISELLSSRVATTLVIERGPNDVLSMMPFENPQHYTLREDKIYQTENLKDIFDSIALAEMVNAEMVWGTDWPTTTSRRLKDGLPAEGWLVREENWPKLTEGYEWWLGSFYPVFRERVGTGLLVIDGRNDMAENNRKAIDYCKQIIETD